MMYKIGNQEYEVIVTRKNNKHTYLRVKEDFKIYITTGIFTREKTIKKLLDSNQTFIEKSIKRMKEKKKKEDLFFYLGDKYDIIFSSRIDKTYVDESSKTIYSRSETMFNKWLLEQIKIIYESHYKDIFDKFLECTKIPNLKLRHMKTRWGVYNRKTHTITLNTELIKYDLECLDYVIVHELCHTVHFDHSKLFWNLVSKYYPNYKMIKKKLKE